MPEFMQIDKDGNMPNILQIYDYTAANLVFLAISLLGFAYPASTVLRRSNHSVEIYAVWYCYSFFLLLFTGLGFIAERQKKHIPELCGSYQDTCKTIYDALTNIGDELILVASFTALAIIPQLLTYLLCGLGGTASTPRFVSQINKIAALSFVKFLAALGGILSADFLAHLAAGGPAALKNLTIGFSMAAFGLTYAATHVAFEEELRIFRQLLSKIGADDTLVRVHKFFTRNVPEGPPKDPYSLTRLALIELLKSDAVYDYMTQHRENR